MNNRRRPGQRVRVIATALIEAQDRLLLAQLARGRFAGFWLLPSATADEGTVAQTARQMVPERTGYPVLEQRCVSVIEEPKIELLALRFVFQTEVGERVNAVADPEISRVRWFTRAAVAELLGERDIVPTLGVMSLVRAWAESRTLGLLEVVRDDALCPCGSGFRYQGCCGWDA